MLRPPRTDKSEALADLDPKFVDALAEFDERLREGTTDTSAVHAIVDRDTSVDDGLKDCLMLLESAWPRTPRRVEEAETEAERADWTEGPRRIGRFNVVRLLGGGGFSLVYLADDSALNRKVALKVPRPHVLFQPDLSARFLREAQAIGGLDHPHIVPVYETGQIGPAVYLAMAYCEGPNLGRWLSERATPIPVELAAEIVASLAEAIQYSHENGILHRDLKPANILLFPKRTEETGDFGAAFSFVPKIADFGLAKLLESALEDTRSSVVLGTPLYMAPEQAAGNAYAIGPATDIYGLGTILHELLTGQPPFSGDNVLQVLERLREEDPVSISKLRADVPRDLQTICATCLSKDPADRYATARALRDDLRHFLNDESISARPLGIMSKAVRITRQPARVRDAGVYTLVVNVLLIVWILIAAAAALVQLGPTNSGTDIRKGYLLGVVSGLVFGALPMLFGWMILKRRAWAALGASISGAASLLYTVPFVLGFIPVDYGGQYKDPNSRILVFSLLSVLFFGQMFLGWLAYRVLRREQVVSRQGKQ
jgi:serine/threonine-protein kinase